MTLNVALEILCVLPLSNSFFLDGAVRPPLPPSNKVDARLLEQVPKRLGVDRVAIENQIADARRKRSVRLRPSCFTALR